MEDTAAINIPEEPVVGMLNTDSPAMESNGEAFPPADWPDHVASEPITNASQEASEKQLGSVEKAVENFQIAVAQLPEEAQPPPPPLPADEPPCAPENQPLDFHNNQAMAIQPEDGASQNAEDGMDIDDTSKDAQEIAPPPEPPLPMEFERLFKGCQENMEDFNGWVYLLQYVEQENMLEPVRKSFDLFFGRYPYCYGYWKKYADIERKHGNIHVAEEVYRRGLQAIPLSVDLWVHYMTFIKENSDTTDPETEGRIRAAYEHAVLAAGTDFRSDRLWESFINWEMEQQKLANVTALYDRLLGIPTQLYSQHFQKFKEHVQTNNPKHFLSEEEFVQLRLELSKATLASMARETDETPAPPEDLPPGTEDLPDPAKRVTEIENMRHKVIENRQEVFNHNEHEVSKRWAFEEGIKRPYFHVKSLERTQLNNWKEYLDFEIENGTPERVVVLFERCLIACALYEEFWIKYAKYLESYSTDGVRHIFKKACTIHLHRKPVIHLQWAAFEEQQGYPDEARRILKTLELVIPSLAMVRLRRVNLERRQGNLEEAEALLREGMENARNTVESSFYAVKLARLLMKVQRSLSKAKKVLLDAIDKDETSSRLYLNLLDMEFNGDVAQNEAEILVIFDRALKSQMPLESRLLFAQRKVEFMEDFGTDVNVLVAAYAEHQKLQRESDALKQKAENGYDSSGEPDAKRQRTDDAAATAAAVADPSMTDMQANNAAYNYNWYQQYGAWGQNAWGQYSQYAQYNQYYPPPPT